MHGGPGVLREKPPGGEVSSGKSKRRARRREEEVRQVRGQGVCGAGKDPGTCCKTLSVRQGAAPGDPKAFVPQGDGGTSEEPSDCKATGTSLGFPVP